jgi:PTH1 family peptidyl-tRNA hydrolase
VIGAVSTERFARLRLGCGPEHPLSSRREHVLRRIKKSEKVIVSEMIFEAGDAVEMILKQGLDAAMNKYNRRKLPPSEEADTK